MGAARPWGRSEAAHAQRLQAELDLLWRNTLGSEDFRRALAASHPDLYHRLRQVGCPTRWNKAARQLTATLYRHWARACWRTEPNGLWAGMGLTRLLPSDESLDGRADTVGRVAVAPHLQPFSDMLRSLSRTADYRGHGRYKVHPSALREGPGVWLLRSPDGQGAQRTRRLRLRHIDCTAADRCIAALAAQGPSSPDELLRIAVHMLPCGDTARSLIDQLMAAQLLIGGLALPHDFETVWDALEGAAEPLHSTHRHAWLAAVEDLRGLCRQLEAAHASLGADAVWQASQDAAARIQALAGQLGLEPVVLPRACLHWDAGLPTQVHLDEKALELARRALDLHERYHHHADPTVSLDRLYAQAQDQGRVGALRNAFSGPVSWDGLAAAVRSLGDDAGLTARLRSFRDPARLGEAGRGGEPSHGTPFGALMLRMGRDTALVQGLSHEPWLSYARFGALLGGTQAPHGHALHAWCDRALTRFAQTANVRLAQLRVACAPLANLLAQPRFSAAGPMDPYGTTPGALADHGVQLCHDGQRRWLQCPGEIRPVLVLGATALDLGARDPLLERLLLTGWRYRPPVATAALQDDWPSGLARTLAPDVRLSRPRWRLAGDAAAALAHAEPADRWARWQRLAREWQLPEWLTVSRDGEAALPMPRDSVLAVEVMFRAPGAGEALAFEIEAPADECLLTDPEGNRHATELILVFSRHHHAWNLRGRPLAAVPDDAGTAPARVVEEGQPA